MKLVALGETLSDGLGGLGFVCAGRNVFSICCSRYWGFWRRLALAFRRPCQVKLTEPLVRLEAAVLNQ
jgi:hypothetical protein